MSKLLEKLRIEKEKLEKKAAEGGGGGKYTKTEWFTPKNGKNLIRFLPNPKDEDELPYVHVKLHYIDIRKKDGGLAKIFVRCLSDFEEDCPACRKYSKLIKTDREAANPYRVNEKFIYSILDYDTKTVKPYSVSPTLQNDILGYYDYGNIFSLDEGRDWQLEKGLDPRKAKPFNVTYKIRPTPKESPFQSKFKSLLEGAVDVSTLYSTNERAKILEWLGEEDVSDEDDVKAELSGHSDSKKKASAAAASASKLKPKKEEEVEDDVPDFGFDEPAPKKKPASLSKKVETEEEEDDFADIDVDDDLKDELEGLMND